VNIIIITQNIFIFLLYLQNLQSNEEPNHVYR
jgi:hypothetical protein